MPKKEKAIRPIVSVGVSGKRFRRAIGSRREFKPPSPNPLVVVLDLRAGSLRSLDAYLKKHGGMPDREVALELRKLLSGSSARTRFRLAVVDHPNLKDTGGRPKTSSSVPSLAEEEIFAGYLKQFELIGKKKEARLQVADLLGRSERTVRRAINKVERHRERERDFERVQERRKIALENLRKKNGHKTSG